MSKPSPSPEFDRRLFAVGDLIASGSFRSVDRPRAMRFAFLTALFGACGIAIAQLSQMAEWSCYVAAAAATTRVAHLLIDKSTWIVRRPSPRYQDGQVLDDAA